jgi:FkbM family methyltransferase
MNILIDAGSCRGRFIKKFVLTPMYSLGWEIHAFEPNPDLVIDCDKAIVHREAAWIRDGKIDFYIGRSIVGSTIIKDKITGRLKDRPIKVPCIDLGGWIMRTFKPEDYIILRMDIEGAEYHVLPQMIETGAIKYVKELYYEPHWDKVGVSKKTNHRLAKALARYVEVYHIL